MPRRPSNYPRVMELGRWLSDFINTPITQYDVIGRIDQAIKLAGIDHVISEEDPVIHALRYVNENPDVIKDDFLSKPKGSLNAEIYGDMVKDFSDLETLSVHVEVIHTLTARRDLYDLFRRICVDKDKPWEYVLSTPHQKDFPPDSLGSMPVSFPDESLTNLLNSYNRIREVLIVRDRKIQVTKRFIAPVDKADNLDCKWVRVSSLVSRIYVSFLKLGGKEYCSFCRSCSKFILAERKEQRQFCGGRCRAASKRKKDQIREVIRKSKENTK